MAVVACALLAACSSKGDLQDETAGWSAQRLYGEARDAMSSKDWAKAVKYFEKLEARYPYGRYAQQAQLEIAYVHWKNDDAALALNAAFDRDNQFRPPTSQPQLPSHRCSRSTFCTQRRTAAREHVAGNRVSAKLYNEWATLDSNQ